jgi:hypothetical protein
MYRRVEWTRKAILMLSGQTRARVAEGWKFCRWRLSDAAKQCVMLIEQYIVESVNEAVA